MIGNANERFVINDHDAGQHSVQRPADLRRIFPGDAAIDPLWEHVGHHPIAGDNRRDARAGRDRLSGAIRAHHHVVLDLPVAQLGYPVFLDMKTLHTAAGRSANSSQRLSSQDNETGVAPGHGRIVEY